MWVTVHAVGCAPRFYTSTHPQRPWTRICLQHSCLQRPQKLTYNAVAHVHMRAPHVPYVRPLAPFLLAAIQELHVKPSTPIHLPADPFAGVIPRCSLSASSSSPSPLPASGPGVPSPAAPPPRAAAAWAARRSFHAYGVGQVRGSRTRCTQRIAASAPPYSFLHRCQHVHQAVRK